MSILKEINELLSPIVPIETGVFSGVPPDEYVVITPLSDSYELFADNTPTIDVQEIRLSLFSKSNYMKMKNNILRTLLGAEFSITDRRYIGHEDDTRYHHYAIDIAKQYGLEVL